MFTYILASVSYKSTSARIAACWIPTYIDETWHALARVTRANFGFTRFIMNADATATTGIRFDNENLASSIELPLYPPLRFSPVFYG